MFFQLHRCVQLELAQEDHLAVLSRPSSPAELLAALNCARRTERVRVDRQKRIHNGGCFGCRHFFYDHIIESKEQ